MAVISYQALPCPPMPVPMSVHLQPLPSQPLLNIRLASPRRVLFLPWLVFLTNVHQRHVNSLSHFMFMGMSDKMLPRLPLKIIFI